MHKIDSDGATLSNEFTEGNPLLSIPATVVSANWLNAVQRELVYVIEQAGLTLNTSGSDTGQQLYAAIQIMIAGGGAATPLIQALVNNQASPADVVGFPQMDVTQVRSFEFTYHILRRTDSSNVQEHGTLAAIWNPETLAWTISGQSYFDDAGTDFVMTLVSGNLWKLQYTTDNIAGASYAGNLRIIDRKVIKV